MAPNLAANGSAIAGSSGTTSAHVDESGGEHESSTSDLVQDPSRDIAMNEYQEKLIVGVPGRKRCQIIYVSTSNTGKRSKVTYKIGDDAPPSGQTPSILPTKEELTQGHNTEAHLIVGVILAHDPFKYSDKTRSTGGKNKDLVDARIKRGVLPPTTDLLRVTVPVSEYIQSQHKFYVVCHQTHGLCVMRLITSDAVFFFEEIYSTLAPNGNLRARQADLGQSCRTLAARNKTPDPRAVTIIKDSSSKVVCHDLEITRAQNAANMLWLQYSLWEVNKDPAQLDVIAETARKILPDLEKKPSNAGTAAFYEFEEELETEEAEKLAQEVKAAYPSICALNVPLILELHTIMRKNDLGAALPYGSLALFLELAHDRAKPGWSASTLTQAVRQILHDVELANKFPATSCHWTVSNEEEEKVAALVGFVSALRALFRELQEYLHKGAQAMQEQHGGVQNHKSIDDLMEKIGAVVDKTALLTLEEQVFAIQGGQGATVLVHGAEIAGKGVKMIDAALGGDQVGIANNEDADARSLGGTIGAGAEG